MTELYSQERMCLLQSLEDLLLLGEGASGAGPFADAVEEALTALLAASPDVEEVTTLCLKDNLEHEEDVPAAAAAAAQAVGGDTGAAQGEARAEERNVLLKTLMLLYYHPRKQCTPQRFLELARLFNTRLFSAPRATAEWKGGAAGAPAPAFLSLKWVRWQRKAVLLAVTCALPALSCLANSFPRPILFYN